MARPRLGESESKRLQMVITEDELKSIEDWQFTNRVPSKSEAIRRLVQIGLEADRRAPILRMAAERLRDAIFRMYDAAGKSDEKDPKLLVGDVLLVIQDENMPVLSEAQSLASYIAAYRESEDLIKARKAADHHRDYNKVWLEALEKRRQELEKLNHRRLK